MTEMPAHCQCRELHNFGPYGDKPLSCGMPARYKCLKCGDITCGNCAWNLPPETLCGACYYEEKQQHE